MPQPEISPPPAKRRRLAGDSPATHISHLAPSIPSRPITDLEPLDLRVFSWNINGISPFLQPSITNFFGLAKSAPKQGPLSRGSSPVQRSPDLRTCLKRWKWPQVVCLQEVKIASKDTKTQQAVRKAVKCPLLSFEHEEEPDYAAYFCLPRDQYNARGFGGKVYGVCMLIRDSLFSTELIEPEKDIQEAKWDLEGRVLVLKIPKKKLVIFNVYAVNGTENAYRSPRTGEIIGTRHDRKRAFYTELKNECRLYENKGWVVVIAGDLNIARSPIDGFPGRRMGEAHVKNRRDFEEKFIQKSEEGLGMIDSFRALHGEEMKYSYRSPSRAWGSSCDRVDLILLSRHVEVSSELRLREADILDEEDERGTSDHLPLYVTLHFESVDHS